MMSTVSEGNYFNKAENQMYKTDEGMQLVINNTFTPNDHKMDIQISANFTSHSEYLFQEIMDLDNVKPEDIYSSLDLEKNRNMVFKAGEGAGQSGSFFFFSYDNKFLIKTMTKREMNLLLSKLE